MNLEIYDLGNDREIRVLPTYHRLKLAPALQAFADQRWEERRSDWVSSWIPNLERMVVSRKRVILDLGITDYTQQIGMVEAVQEEQPFAPDKINGLAVGTFMVTSDQRIVLPRRSANVMHAPLRYNMFCGWMSTLNLVERARCADAELIREPWLYSPLFQAKRVFEKESMLRPDEYEIHGPAILTRAAPHSLNLELEFVGGVGYTAAELIERMQGVVEFAPGRKEADLAAAVPLEDLAVLLENQAALREQDPQTHVPKDHRDIILLDRTIAGLLHLYTPLTAQRRPAQIVEALKQGGITVVEQDLPEGTYTL